MKKSISRAPQSLTLELKFKLPPHVLLPLSRRKTAIQFTSIKMVVSQFWCRTTGSDTRTDSELEPSRPSSSIPSKHHLRVSPPVSGYFACWQVDFGTTERAYEQISALQK